MTATSTNNTRTAIFPGSFHPFTRGHADIVERGLKIFDKIIIAIGVNSEKDTAGHNEDLHIIRSLYEGNPAVEVCVYSTLTVDFAKAVNAGFILRGVRSVKDFEYERNLADINTQLSGIETVILFSRPELAAISSSLVRELKAYGHDVTKFLP